MQEAPFFIELIKYIGFPALIFIMWYFTHQSTTKTFDNIIKEQAKREERNFSLLKDMLETNQYHASLLAKIAQQIETNQWCPVIKMQIPHLKFSKQGE